MGRPPIDNPKKKITIMIKPENLKEINRIANKGGLSRSQLIDNLLEVGLDGVKIYESLGIVSAVGYGRQIVNWFKKSKEEGKVVIGEDGDFKIVKK